MTAIVKTKPRNLLMRDRYKIRAVRNNKAPLLGASSSQLRSKIRKWRAIKYVRREGRYVTSFLLFVIFKMAAAINPSLTNDRHAKSGHFISAFDRSRRNNLRSTSEPENESCDTEKSKCEDDFKPGDWREGRRVIELGHLADQLKGCINCGIPIQLANCFQERRYGLGSLLYIDCKNCDSINVVSTGKRHRNKSQKGMLIWDVNYKLSLGKTDELFNMFSFFLSFFHKDIVGIVKHGLAGFMRYLSDLCSFMIQWLFIRQNLACTIYTLLIFLETGSKRNK